MEGHGFTVQDQGVPSSGSFFSLHSPVLPSTPGCLHRPASEELSALWLRSFQFPIVLALIKWRAGGDFAERKSRSFLLGNEEKGPQQKEACAGMA